MASSFYCTYVAPYCMGLIFLLRWGASQRLILAATLLWWVGVLPCPAAHSLSWKKNPDRVSADISRAPLTEVLKMIGDATGWDVYVQPDTEHVADVRFVDRPTSDGLKLLLGDLNYALLTEDGRKRLMVFRTGVGEATLLIGVSKDPRENTSLPIPTELVVTVKAGVDIDALAKKYRGKVTGRLEALRTYRLEFETAEDAAKALKELEKDPDVEQVQQNYYVEKPTDLKDLDATPLAELGLKPSNSTDPNDCDKVIIGLIDTTTLRDTTGAKGGSKVDSFLLPQIDVAGPSATTYTSPPHGRSMAEAILRSADFSSQGKAKLQILPVNVYGANTQASTYDVANGVYRAINAGAKIINMSLGSEAQSPFLAQVIRQGKAQDVLFIAAAGNKPTTTATYPAADPSVLAVTASDRTGNLANYANRGNFVDVIAPGSSVFQFNGQHYLSTGTSVATAYVSGLASAMADPCKKSYSSIDSQIRQNLAIKK